MNPENADNQVLFGTAGLEEPAWAANAAEYALEVLSALGKQHWQVSLTFCSDEVIQQLNRDYRGIDAPTDVLSFSLDASEPGLDTTWYVAGDIIISIPAVYRNAEDFGVDADEELRRLIVHGLLHLSGMDHETNDPDHPMLMLQEQILHRLGGRILS
ncbi:MAG: rRNA maturation RNase YbeY [Rectinemataceae bacterium]